MALTKLCVYLNERRIDRKGERGTEIELKLKLDSREQTPFHGKQQKLALPSEKQPLLSKDKSTFKPSVVIRKFFTGCVGFFARREGSDTNTISAYPNLLEANELGNR